MSALLIVGHGTRDDEGADEFRKFVRRVETRAVERGTADAVAGGFIELSPPPLKDAVTGLVDAGHRDLTAVPLILLAAGHAKGDIPAALARERERHPGVRTRYARPLGPHPVILDLLRRRVAEHAGERPDAVLLVGRGTTDPDANADLFRAARLLWETSRELGVRQVEAAFVSLAQPSVPDGLDRLRALGAERVLVLPFFLFPGVLPTRIHTQVAQWRTESAIPAAVADVIGDCDELADLVIERYIEADGRGGAPVGMNCDACVYRIAMPGFEARVGQEQHPHDHPEDPSHQHGHHHHPHHAPRHPGAPARPEARSVQETRVSRPVGPPPPSVG
ncbi:sirohydrochlorin chelatase [Actinospica sp. MGRD01-02]|uniref:Sirohydrochlorin chelatase n=1 Tax=Actinospica acidithermotolerans TaxID=2828514 RepID=A0A941EG71_9ACTN|nr:sirohydrochlorin chelatase [Actinospica acidithermotolerans]MBR7830866.1 sirohydrochlorin chelatase [Actinospica acidithermotolerans]